MCPLLPVQRSLGMTLSKEQWKAALTPAALGSPPNLLIIDATAAQSRFNSRAVGRIPEFLELARAQLGAASGAVIVTDEPVLYFTLRSKLVGAGVAITPHVLIAEALEHESVLSEHAKPDSWVPADRSLANCHVEIMDREAAAIAMSLYRIGQDLAIGVDRQACEEASFYLLRTSTMPAGYRDHTI
jgi:hypothetical protein